MFQRTRHFAPRFRPWDASEARAAIQEIAADAQSMLDPVGLWPSHPMEDGVPDGTGSIYFGAAGVIWALDYLHRAGAQRTLAALAVRSRLGATWPAVTPSSGSLALCRHCHGAPGIVTVFASAPFSTPEFETLLARGGELTWNAGPLVKGSNLCHGAGGNGYALLKLYRRTKDPLWLERARAFAMAAIDQVRGARAAFGRGRYSLRTGDPGLAVYLWHCMTGEPRFPTIDVL